MQASAYSDNHAASRENFSQLARHLFGNIKQRFPTSVASHTQTLDYVSLGQCRLSKISASAHGVCGANVVAHSADIDAIKVLVQVSGKSWLDQKSHPQRIDLAKDAAIIYDPAQPYFLMNRTHVEQLILQIPRHLFDDRCLTRLKNPVFLPPIGEKQSHTLTAFIRTTSHNNKALSQEVRASLGQSLSVFARGLVSESFRTDMLDSLDNTSLLLLRERIKSFVASRLHDPELSLEMIAKRMGCSTRYLHKAFEAEGITLQRYIWKVRLEASRDLLTAPDYQQHSIADIAIQCGFNSSSHFSRLFRQYFHCPPRSMRESAQHSNPDLGSAQIS